MDIGQHQRLAKNQEIKQVDENGQASRNISRHGELPIYSAEATLVD